MEFKIECENYVMLYALNNVLDCDSTIDNYELENDTLKGNVLIAGNYLKKDEEFPVEFKDSFPFTIVFSTKDIIINEVKVDNFSYVFSGEGINCTFNVVVNYDETNNIEKKQPLEENNIIVTNKDEYDEVTKEFEEKLDLALNRSETVEEVSNVPFYLKLNQRQAKIKVFYYNDDKELDKISKNSGESLHELLENSETLGDYRRIIIKS